MEKGENRIPDTGGARVKEHRRRDNKASNEEQRQTPRKTER